MRALAIIAAEHRNMRLVAGALAVLGDRFAAGSGRPCLAARVMSRESLEKILERFLS